MVAMKRIAIDDGERFGKFTVVSPLGKNQSGRYQVLCLCDCGNKKAVPEHVLRTGKSKSCGCLKDGNPKHGMAGTRLYNIWWRMKHRCQSPSNKDWLRYGGRGIEVCDEWQEFVTFKNWAFDNGYLNTLTIDRINNDGNYEPNNCRWSTMKEQNMNRHLTRASNGRYAKEW